MQKELTCFKAYDIRGEININIDEAIAYRIGRSVAQHFNAKSIVVAFDARETSPAFSKAVGLGIMDAGSDLIDIGLSGTEEMYWAVSNFSACAGIVVTASHNPINYNGMKIVKSGSKPLDDDERLHSNKKISGVRELDYQVLTKKELLLDRSQMKPGLHYVSKVL